MKITKVVFLSFAGVSNASATISVPFKVKRIHVKSIGYTAQNQPPASTAIYGCITSDLTDYQPLGLFFNDTTYSYATGNDLELELYTPKVINGTYNFTLLNEVGNPYTPTGSGVDDVTLILEFNDESELL